MQISIEFMSCYLLISLMGHNKLLKKTYLVKLGGGASTPPASHRANGNAYVNSSNYFLLKVMMF